MKKRLLILLWLASLVFVRATTTDDLIDSDLARMFTAFKSYDASTLADMTYPPALALLGGKASAVSAMRREFDILSRHGARITGLESIKPYARYSGDVHDFVIIPVRQDMRIQTHEFELETFIIAVKFHDSATWQYATGSPQTVQDRDTLFPDLPKSVALSTPRRIRLD